MQTEPVIDILLDNPAHTLTKYSYQEPSRFHTLGQLPNMNKSDAQSKVPSALGIHICRCFPVSNHPSAFAVPTVDQQDTFNRLVDVFSQKLAQCESDFGL